MGSTYTLKRKRRSLKGKPIQKTETIKVRRYRMSTAFISVPADITGQNSTARAGKDSALGVTSLKREKGEKAVGELVPIRYQRTHQTR